MLSYRHGFHAGNFADVHKHLVLVALLDYLTHKETPLCYIDTHSAAGRYDLKSSAAMKNREHLLGVARIVEAKEHAPPLAQTYLRLIDAMNTAGSQRYYPGSPAIAAQLLRPQDRLVLSELHASEYPLLKDLFSRDKRATVLHQNGYQTLKASIPPKEKRGLVLIDPAYELADEFDRVARETIAAHRKWPIGCYAVWYPILLRSTIDRFERKLLASGIHKILISEICPLRDDVPKRLNGSGMLIINPPWQLDAQLPALQAWVLEKLQQGEIGRQRCEWLVEE